MKNAFFWEGLKNSIFKMAKKLFFSVTKSRCLGEKKGVHTYEFTGLLPAKTRTDRNGPANAQAPAMIQLLRRSNPEFTNSYGFCIEMCGMFIFVAIA